MFSLRGLSQHWYRLTEGEKKRAGSLFVSLSPSLSVPFLWAVPSSLFPLYSLITIYILSVSTFPQRTTTKKWKKRARIYRRKWEWNLWKWLFILYLSPPTLLSVLGIIYFRLTPSLTSVCSSAVLWHVTLVTHMLKLHCFSESKAGEPRFKSGFLNEVGPRISLIDTSE